MSEDLIGVPLESIENRGLRGVYVKIAGTEYRALDYVEPYVTRRRIGDLVDVSFSLDKDGSPVLTKIAPHKSGGEKQSAKGKPQDKPAKEISAVLRKVQDPYLMVTKEGEEKITLYCLSNEMRDRIQTDPALNIPQRIKVSIDGISFVQRYELGESVPEDSLPPIAAPIVTGGQIKQEKEKAKQATISEPPKEEPEKEAPKQEEKREEPPLKTDDKSASPHTLEEQKEPEILPLHTGGYVVRFGGTCSLDNYENIKLEIEGVLDPKNPGEREDLIRYWDETLGLLGRNSPVTKDKIDSFRRRVIMGALSSMEAPKQEGSRKVDRSEPNMTGVAYGTGIS